MNDLFRRRCLLYAQLRLHQRRVARAQALVARALERCHHPYIAFSTGKDSTCVAHLVWQYHSGVPAVYFDADCAFPESLALLESLERSGAPVLRWPTEPFLETLRRVGGPAAPGCEAATMESTVYAPVRALLAAQHFDGVFLGLRAEESQGRAALLRARGSLYTTNHGLLTCLPVAEWTFMDIWAYLISRQVPYCAAYDRLLDLGIPERSCRLSYWAGESLHARGRWAVLRQGWPELFARFAALFPEVRHYV